MIFIWSKTIRFSRQWMETWLIILKMHQTWNTAISRLNSGNFSFRYHFVDLSLWKKTSVNAIRNPIWTSKISQKKAFRNSAYLYHIESFIFHLIENYEVLRETPGEFRVSKAEKHLGFFIDAYFDKSNRKWFWSNKNEIQADQWAYQCSNLPHQPATDLVVTMKFTGDLHCASCTCQN